MVNLLGLRKASLAVAGMSCHSCETRIEKALSSLAGISSVSASLAGGRVDIEYDPAKIVIGEAESAIIRLGYSIRKEKDPSTLFALGAGLLLITGYAALSASGILNSFPMAERGIGYGALFLIGLLTSVHCVAMCGGIAISQSIGRALVAEGQGRFRRLLPGLAYNGGRMLSYTAIGAAAGALGSAFDFSPRAKGAVMAAAAVLMLGFGLRMLGLIKMPRLGLRMPAFLVRAESFLARRGSFAVGLLNGLMPCGPLQAMQLYALGTGSALAGAISMLVFSAGTVPLLFSFSLAAAAAPKRFVPAFLKASAVLLIFLGFVTLGRAAALSGISIPGFASSRSVSPMRAAPAPDSLELASGIFAFPAADKGSLEPLKAKVQGGVQTIVTEIGPNSYPPFSVTAGVPLKWTIRAKKTDLNGCNSAIIVPEYGIQRRLKAGDTLIEFTPKKKGIISFSCWMGMIRSKITVVSATEGTL